MTDNQFHLGEVDFSLEPEFHISRVQLRLNRLEFKELVKQIWWERILDVRGTDYHQLALFGLVTQFFQCLRETAHKISGDDSFVGFSCPLYTAKFVIDMM